MQCKLMAFVYITDITFWINATFKIISIIYHGCKAYSWRIPEYSEKATDLPQIIDNIYYITLCRVHLAKSM
jgi:hypothetical protein